jgi:acyl phosphate:glycerol-3-phosphate acyltransferase
MSLETLLPLLICALAGYLLGSIPSGYLVVKAFTGQDVRKIGSGRTGGTNVLRVPGAGRKAFFLTIFGDVSKGALAVLAGRYIAGDFGQLLSGFFALVGNNWSLFLGGRGGAGVMTTLGTMLIVSPLPPLLFAPIPLLVIRLTHIASLGSLTAAIGAILIYLALAILNVEPWSHLGYVIAIGLLLIAVHVPNIQRLLAGRERRAGK